VGSKVRSIELFEGGCGGCGEFAQYPHLRTNEFKN